MDTFEPDYVGGFFIVAFLILFWSGIFLVFLERR